MQKIILLPKLSIKQHFFISCLIAFNETFACLNENEHDTTMLWHEAVNGRSAAVVAAAYVKCLETCNADKITNLQFGQITAVDKIKTGLFLPLCASVLTLRQPMRSKMTAH